MFDDLTGAFATHKTLTTPEDPAHAIASGIRDLSSSQKIKDGEIALVIHGTTLVINALIERKGILTGLITTKGFRDILEMRREMRYDIYDIAAPYPQPLVPRDLRAEVTERVGADGRVMVALDRREVEEVVDGLVDQGVKSIAVCLLHSYSNPSHERTIAEIAMRRHPLLSVSISSNVFPEMREFERTTTTVANAYVKPTVGSYIDRLGKAVTGQSGKTGLYLMLSAGGLTSPQIAAQYPIRLIESGPVGGALASAHIGRIAGLESLVVFDMGGTTAKACLIEGGQPLVSTEYEVDRTHRFKKGSGTPLGVPTIDIIEIGAGGGSIAEINQLGLLQVGPHSAGAQPGPICYGRGGVRPTVTDADLTLGYIDPAYFLSGKMPLDAASARAGIDRHIGAPLGFTAIDAAWAVHEVVNENMAAAVRMYAAEKGVNIAEATIVASGGAGPVHAVDFARRMNCRKVLIPCAAGVFSALGFLVAPVSYEVARTHVGALDSIRIEDLEKEYGLLAEEASAVVRNALPGAAVTITRSADMRYVGQGASVRVSVGDDLDPGKLREAFYEEYRKRYGHSYSDIEVQMVTPRVIASAPVRSERAMSLGAPPDTSAAAERGHRLAFDRRQRAMIPHQVYELAHVPSDRCIAGPALIEAGTSTIVVGDGARATRDGRGWISVEIE